LHFARLGIDMYEQCQGTQEVEELNKASGPERKTCIIQEHMHNLAKNTFQQISCSKHDGYLHLHTWRGKAKL